MLTRYHSGSRGFGHSIRYVHIGILVTMDDSVSPTVRFPMATRVTQVSARSSRMIFNPVTDLAHTNPDSLAALRIYSLPSQLF